MATLTLQRTTVDVRLRDQEPRTVDGYALEGSPDWVVHRSIDDDRSPSWNVTHAPSGLHCGRQYRVRRDALELIEGLAGLEAGEAGDRAWLRTVAEVVTLHPSTARNGRTRRTFQDAPIAPRREVYRSPMREALEAAGWDARDEWGEAGCPCGNFIEPDGACPSCGPNPCRVAGLI